MQKTFPAKTGALRRLYSRPGVLSKLRLTPHDFRLALRFICLGMFFTLAIGCRVTRTYEGPPRPGSEVAAVYDKGVTYGVITINAGVATLDGRELSRFGRGTKTELLPGTHTLGIIYSDYWFGRMRSANSLCFVTFTAEAGGQYEIATETIGESWRIWLVDKQTGSKIECLYK